MILVWFERSRGDEFDSGNNFQVEKKFCKKCRNTLRKSLELIIVLITVFQNIADFFIQINLEVWSILIVI